MTSRGCLFPSVAAFSYWIRPSSPRPRAVHCIVLGALAAACGGGVRTVDGAPPPVEMEPPAELCRGIRNSFECARAVERFQIENGTADVRRRDSLLVVTLAGRDSAMFVDAPGVEGVSYSYQRYLAPIEHHLIHLQFWEGNAYLLLHHRTGRRTDIQGVPIVAGDGRRFVTTSSDLVAQYDPTEVQVWRVGDGTIELEWSYQPPADPGWDAQPWGPADARWRGPGEIVIRRVYLDGSPSDHLLLRRGRRGWVVTATSQPGG